MKPASRVVLASRARQPGTDSQGACRGIARSRDAATTSDRMCGPTRSGGDPERRQTEASGVLSFSARQRRTPYLPGRGHLAPRERRSAMATNPMPTTPPTQRTQARALSPAGRGSPERRPRFRRTDPQHDPSAPREGRRDTMTANPERTFREMPLAQVHRLMASPDHFGTLERLRPRAVRRSRPSPCMGRPRTRRLRRRRPRGRALPQPRADRAPRGDVPGAAGPRQRGT